MSWKTETFGTLLRESRIPSDNPDPERRIRVKLNVQGVEKRPVGAEKEGATNQFIRRARQFIYGKQNFHKGAFGIIPKELDGFETSSDIPSFDVREDCLPEWIYYYLKSGNRYLELTQYARGVGSKRIHPKQLADYKIPLPSIEDQKRIIKELQIIESNGINDELSYQLDLVKQLRQAFLSEAMQGKLTAQWRSENPDVVPASELLKKIKDEKEKLVKVGKPKKQKPLSPIKDDEIPFEIPESWEWCRFGLLGNCRLGKMLDGNKNKGRLVNYLRNTNVQWKRIDLEDIKSIRLEPHEIKEFQLIEGDLLICEGGVPGRCAKWKGITEYYAFQKALHRFRSNGSILTDLVEYYLEFSYNNEFLHQYFTGNQIKHLTGQSLEKVIIPLPPVSEQQQIVTKLDELMKFCDMLEESIKASQQQNEMLLQQVLREALEPKK